MLNHHRFSGDDSISRIDDPPRSGGMNGGTRGGGKIDPRMDGSVDGAVAVKITAAVTEKRRPPQTLHGHEKRIGPMKSIVPAADEQGPHFPGLAGFFGIRLLPQGGHTLVQGYFIGSEFAGIKTDGPGILHQPARHTVLKFQARLSGIQGGG